MPLSSKIFPASMILIFVALFAAMLFVIVMSPRWVATQPCRDTLLRPEAWTGESTIQCPRADHTLMRDGDRWRCSCPNLPRAEEAKEP